MQQLDVSIITNGLLREFEEDHVDMLIPGPVKNGEGIVYFKSPYEDYTLRGTWKNGKLNGNANLSYEKSYVVADVFFWDGVVDGLCIVYDLNNDVVFHGFLYDGMRDGICIDIDKKTKQRNYTRYEDGKVVSVIKPLPFHRNVFIEVSTSGELLYVGCFYPDFSDYNGLFITYQNNLPTDLSILKDEKKTVLKQFNGNQMVEYDPSGNIIYEGEFIQNVKYLYPRHGKGNEFRGNHVFVYNGDFANGYRHGQGVLYENGVKRYEGGWKLGKASGQGVLFDEQGSEVFRGDFLQGCVVVKDGEQYKVPAATAVFSSQYSLPKTPEQLSTILLGLSEKERKETRLEADAAQWWLEDKTNTTLQPFSIESEPPPDVNLIKLLQQTHKRRLMVWIVTTVIVLLLAGLSFFLFFSMNYVVTSCDKQLWNPSLVRSIRFAAGVCDEPTDVVIDGCSRLSSVVFEKGAFRSGGHVTVSNNRRLTSLAFEEECFTAGGSLDVTGNAELEEVSFGDHAFEKASSLQLERSATLKNVVFGDFTFRYVPVCSFIHFDCIQSIVFGKESFYFTKSAIFESAFSDCQLFIDNIMLTTIQFGASSFHDVRFFQIQGL